ncbi:conserved unknown protein [Ectocarpus siliculosus]|uniref:PHD-type domain-containing protein n=1 Tax=Ectocarpus siliculosus TaxID=2880 RepID=D7FS64_ECTSI|nr:conserved unknown protein [Ectocarpus siliculosus]|eukprot:CBJ31005.1 conserved unknown protein [Ectocarpus siliculosus]
MSRAKGPKTGPGSRGGKGGKGAKVGAGAKGDADKHDPAKPKKARSAYNFYLLKRIAQLKEEGVVEQHRDRFAQAAGEWRDMTFGERIPYEDMAKADKERHQKDLDIATRNLNAALHGTVPKHGQGMCSAIGFPGLKALAANSPHEDVCAVCKEEGDLLCCDFCTSTYHLTCLDPPMLSLPSDDVQWACPACSASIEVAEMSAPQLKPKRERKDGRKRQRTSTAAVAGSSSPRAGADAGGNFTIPKLKKPGKKRNKAAAAAAGEEGEAKLSPRIVKREEEKDELTTAAAVLASSANSANRNRMVKAPQKAEISPRVGLGLTASTDEMSAATLRYPDLSGSRNNDKSPTKAMMSLAVAAASVAANEAAIAAAVAAAAAAPAAAPPPPPKALGLKKLLHQRVQHDEANSNPAFSPKKLLKHRLLAAQQATTTTSSDPAPSPSPPASSPSTGGGGNSYSRGSDDAGSADRYAGQSGERGASGAKWRRSGFAGAYAGDSGRNAGPYGGREARGSDERDRIAAEGELNGRVLADGAGYGRRNGTGGMNDNVGGRSENNRGRHADDGTAEGSGVGGGDRAALDGERRRRAELGGGGYDAGRNGDANANGVHGREASRSGWGAGSSGERNGRFAKGMNNPTDKWTGGGESGRMDAPRHHGFSPAGFEEEGGRRQGRQPQYRGDSYSSGQGDATQQRRDDGGGERRDNSSSGGRGYNNKASALAPPPPPPPPHCWDGGGGGRSSWRPDRPSEGKREPDGRTQLRESAGRGGFTDESRERQRRPRSREGEYANGVPQPGSCSRSVDDERDGRGRPPWGGNALRGGSRSRAADGGGDRERGFSAAGRAGGQHYGSSNGRVGDSAAAVAGGGGRGEGGSYGGAWSDRKRSLERFEGQDWSHGSPKKGVLFERRAEVGLPAGTTCGRTRAEAAAAEAGQTTESLPGIPAPPARVGQGKAAAATRGSAVRRRPSEGLAAAAAAAASRRLAHGEVKGESEVIGGILGAAAQGRPSTAALGTGRRLAGAARKGQRGKTPRAVGGGTTITTDRAAAAAAAGSGRGVGAPSGGIGRLDWRGGVVAAISRSEATTVKETVRVNLLSPRSRAEGAITGGRSEPGGAAQAGTTAMAGTPRPGRDRRVGRKSRGLLAAEQGRRGVRRVVASTRREAGTTRRRGDRARVLAE